MTAPTLTAYQRERLDKAHRAYRRAYNRGYSLSEQGYAEKAQAILDKANLDLRRVMDAPFHEERRDS